MAPVRSTPTPLEILGLEMLLLWSAVVVAALVHGEAGLGGEDAVVRVGVVEVSGQD